MPFAFHDVNTQVNYDFGIVVQLFFIFNAGD